MTTLIMIGYNNIMDYPHYQKYSLYPTDIPNAITNDSVVITDTYTPTRLDDDNDVEVSLLKTYISVVGEYIKSKKCKISL